MPRSHGNNATKSERRVRYVPAVGPRLKRLLAVVFALFALLAVNSVYLVSITIAGAQYQNWFYMIMFMLHLVLGIAIVLPIVLFGAFHIKNAHNRPNRRAVRAGYALFATSLVVLITGFVLTRVDLLGVRFELNNPFGRSLAYWLHVLCPLVAVWLFILHRLAGRRIKWRVGLSWAGVAAVFAGAMLVLQMQDPRAWNVAGPKEGEQYFFPSLARTATGNFIDKDVLDNNEYCAECHADVHDQWIHSVHRFSSFNNPPYEFSVKNTRRAMMERHGDVKGSRFCAGCHDPVPFFSGEFDKAHFDDPEYDLKNDPSAQAGITCTVCHSIVHINSVRGNADYTIDEPIHYPFAFSDNAFLRWVNRQLIKAKPEFHKATFLKPDVHRSTEFCGTCHKVHLPVELNDYKFIRGQNHFDAFWISGVSGYGITSFYYPPQAQANCNGCHMPLEPVSERPNFGARVRDESGLLKTMTHQFPSANTAIPYLLKDKLPDAEGAIANHQEFLEGVMRLDIFGVRKGGRIDGELSAPLRPSPKAPVGPNVAAAADEALPAIPALQPGETYLLETVIRTVKMGHMFTQGTADSNEVWMDVTVSSGGKIIGRSGGRNPRNNEVDPWSHFVNAFVIDKNGNRINRRNAEDIFIALYNNQIPPGAASIVHYKLQVPPDVREPITVNAKLQFRKFDTEYMRLVMDDPDYVNDLPITTLAEDTVTFPVSGGPMPLNPESTVELWQRWNDYGIALFRAKQLRQAAEAFTEVKKLGRADGPLNLARVYLEEGTVQADAQAALADAGTMNPPAYEWSLLWFGAEVAKNNGDYDKAIVNLRDIIKGGFRQAEGRNFDFSRDYRVRVALADALYQQGLDDDNTPEQQRSFMQEALGEYLAALEYEPEMVEAHYGLKQVYKELGDEVKEAEHAALHAKYKPDDNAGDYAIAQARLMYPAANHAAEAVVIYDLQRPGAFELPQEIQELAQRE